MNKLKQTKWEKEMSSEQLIRNKFELSIRRYSTVGDRLKMAKDTFKNQMIEPPIIWRKKRSRYRFVNLRKRQWFGNQ